MKTATIIFTYNRSRHTERVLEALRLNMERPQRLIIFQDGRKETEDAEEWEKVGQVIGQVDWCDTEIHIMEKNKGLARSVIDGINYAMQRFDAAIVLEDDCVPHPMFLSFMYACLEKYADEKRVYAAGGCPEPIGMKKEDRADAYFCQRASSLGWGTWKDRWQEYDRDYEILKRIKADREMKERLTIWGNDLESHLAGTVTGKCDSWAVFWALKVIEKDGLFVCPYESLITNIGYDGSGVHSGTERVDIDYRSPDNMEKFILPDEITVRDSCRQGYRDMLCLTPKDERYKCYQDLLCRWIRLKQRRTDLKFDCKGCRIASWGKGRFLDLLRSEWQEAPEIRCIIETTPHEEEYNGLPIYTVREIPEEIDTVIVIPFCDIDIIRRKLQRWRPDIKNIVPIDRLIQDGTEG